MSGADHRHIRTGSRSVRRTAADRNARKKRNGLRPFVESFRGDRENIVLVGGIFDVGIFRVFIRLTVDIDVGVDIDKLRTVVGGLVHRIGVDDARFNFLKSFLRLRRRFATS